MHNVHALNFKKKIISMPLSWQLVLNVFLINSCFLFTYIVQHYIRAYLTALYSKNFNRKQNPYMRTNNRHNCFPYSLKWILWNFTIHDCSLHKGEPWKTFKIPEDSRVTSFKNNNWKTYFRLFATRQSLTCTTCTNETKPRCRLCIPMNEIHVRQRALHMHSDIGLYFSFHLYREK